MIATPTATARPPITTHVLDTALGRPAAGVRVRLLARPAGAPAGASVWVPAPGAAAAAAASTTWAATTDGDGRCSTLLLPGAPRPPPGVYRIEFDVGEYFERTAREVPGYGGGGVVREGGGNGNGASFYPSAAVDFVISPSPPSAPGTAAVSRPEHLHIPLTFSPFGYSTYRGS
jgi:5-hydroxyisourate hydrolase-like protein (transthyretin family)